MTTELLVTLENFDGSNIELATIRQLVELELELCPRCRKIHKKTGYLPFHCNSCFQLRDERWLQHLIRRTKSLISTGMIGSA